MSDPITYIPPAAKAAATTAPSNSLTTAYGAPATVAEQVAKNPPAPAASGSSSFGSSMSSSPSTPAPGTNGYVAPASSYASIPGNAPGSTTTQGAIIGAAPAGAQQSANGLYYGADGKAYTGAPAGGTSSPATSTGLPSPTGGTPGPNGTYGAATSALAPTGPLSEDDFFKEIYNQLSPVISAINGAETSAETAAYAAGTNQQNDLSGSLGARGLAGSGEASREAANTNLATAGAVASAKQTQASALSSAYQFLSSQAWTEYTNARDNNQGLAQDYQKSMQTTALATVKGLAESGITSGADLQSKNPQAYLSLLQYYNNDPAALDAALTLNQPIGNIAQSWISGTTYNQIITDPITGKPKVQTLDLGITPPTGWITQKVGTTSVVLQDPNNPANTIIYATNPFTGDVTITGTGTEAGLNKTTPGAGTTAASTTPGTAGETASTTVSNVLGVDPTTSLSDVIGTSGIGAIVAAMTKNEGGSPAGVVNNPGNIKFVGAPGQTDSGVKAADGGTFASYASPAAGQNAIAALVTDAASGTNPNYGASPTLQSFVDTYTNTGSAKSSNADTGSNGLSKSQYGALAGVPGFNPSVPGIDQAAYNYISEYMNGQTPSAASIGISTRTGSGAAFNTVAARAREVYQQATGQNLPNQKTLAGNLKLIVGNNTLVNKLRVQSQTIGANFGLNLENLSANNVNKNAPIINGVLDTVLNALGDPDVAQYVAQNATLQNEMSSLLAVKNASGTTVADKVEAAGLLPKNASAAQQASVYKILMQEAQNADTAAQLANVQLYQQTDPLGLDPENPLNGPITLVNTSTGESYAADPGQLTADNLQDAINSGYVMQ